MRQQLPAKLLGYKFKKLLPEEKQLPAPTLEYFEMECAKAFHYPGWAAWRAESQDVRARLLAHEMNKGMRDSYHFEQRVDGESESEPKQRTPAPWDAIRTQFFGS